MRPGPSLLLALLAALLLVAGCGGEDDQLTAPAEEARERGRLPFVSIGEMQGLIDQRISVVRQGLEGASLGPELEPEPVDVVRFAAQTGREFVIAIFATPRAAQAGAASAREQEIVEDGGAVSRAANVVAAFPAPPSEVRTYEEVDELMREIAEACRRPGGEGGLPEGDPELPERLRQLQQVCYEDADLPGAAGTGTDPQELAPAGTTLQVGGLAYTVQTSRQLNPSIQPDQAFLDGREPPRDEVWFGAFLRVCNERGRERTPTDQLKLVNAFGRELRPTELPGDDAFGYRPEPLGEDECLPEPGSPSDRTIEGSLVLFSVPVDFLGERPVALQITGRSGATERVALDL